MIIGVPKEIKNNENRVGMTPAGVAELVKKGHTVYVQATAAGMTIFDLPPSRAERDLEQWRTIIDWVEEDGE